MQKKPEANRAEINIQMPIMGTMLIALSLGSIFSLDLVAYSYFILAATTIVVISYVNGSIVSRYRKLEPSITTHIFGGVGGLLILGFLGMQSPQIPFKPYILALGIILALPAAAKIIWRKLR